MSAISRHFQILVCVAICGGAGVSTGQSGANAPPAAMGALQRMAVREFNAKSSPTGRHPSGVKIHEFRGKPQRRGTVTGESAPAPYSSSQFEPGPASDPAPAPDPTPAFSSQFDRAPTSDPAPAPRISEAQLPSFTLRPTEATSRAQVDASIEPSADPSESTSGWSERYPWAPRATESSAPTEPPVSATANTTLPSFSDSPNHAATKAPEHLQTRPFSALPSFELSPSRSVSNDSPNLSEAPAPEPPGTSEPPETSLPPTLSAPLPSESAEVFDPFGSEWAPEETAEPSAEAPRLSEHSVIRPSPSVQQQQPTPSRPVAETARAMESSRGPSHPLSGPAQHGKANLFAIPNDTAGWRTAWNVQRDSRDVTREEVEPSDNQANGNVLPSPAGDDDPRPEPINDAPPLGSAPLLADISLAGPTPIESTREMHDANAIRWLDEVRLGGTDFHWVSPQTMHQPLYFEDVNLERAGHSMGMFQPVVSAAHFFSRIPAMPYLLTAHPYRECVYTLGHYRPGSPAPMLKRSPRLSAKAGLVQIGVTTGAVFLVP